MANLKKKKEEERKPCKDLKAGGNFRETVRRYIRIMSQIENLPSLENGWAKRDAGEADGLLII